MMISRELRGLSLLLLGAALVVVAQGCGGFRSETSYVELLEMRLSSPKGEVRPGEALLVRVKLRNSSSKTQTVRQLNALSLDFRRWSESEGERVRARFVSSEKEDLSLRTELPPGRVLPRTFLFTDATEAEGEYFIQAVYSTPVDGERESPMVVSRPLRFTVAGTRAFRRGEAGLISSEDAVRTAKDYLGRPTTVENAKLVRNEAGFVDWWVTLTVSDEALAAGERAEKAYFVNPYVGRVRKEAKPREDESGPATPEYSK